jgi:hypothetical protein
MYGFLHVWILMYGYMLEIRLGMESIGFPGFWLGIGLQELNWTETLKGKISSGIMVFEEVECSM